MRVDKCPSIFDTFWMATWLASVTVVAKVCWFILIRRDGQARRVRILFVPSLVFLQNGDGRRKQRHVARAGFLVRRDFHPRLVYPQLPVVVPVQVYAVIRCSSSSVRKVGHVSSFLNSRFRLPTSGSKFSHPLSLAMPSTLRKQLMYLVNVFCESFLSVRRCISNVSMNSPFSS